MKLTELKKYDPNDFLDSPEDIEAYINAALEENDPSFLMKALGNVAKAKGMSNIANQTGLARQQLYKTLSDNGNPRLDTLLKLCNALGYKLTVEHV